MNQLVDREKLRTINSYTLNARFLEKKSKELYEMHRRDFEDFLKGIKTGTEILDVGCGTGDAAKYFQIMGFQVTAIDNCLEMVKSARRKGIKRAFRMDMEDIKIDYMHFDAIWCMNSLLHVPKIKVSRVLERFQVLLKKNGLLMVCVKEGESEEIKQDKYNPNTSRFFSYWQKEELEEKIQKAGFNIDKFYKEGMGDKRFLNFFAYRN